MDQRIERLAQVLVNYSVRVKPGEWVVINGGADASPLLQALYKEILRAGGYPQLVVSMPWTDYTLFKYGNDDQLAFVSPTNMLTAEKADVLMSIWSSENTRTLSTIDPARQKQRSQAVGPMLQTTMARISTKSLRWVGTIFPSSGYAQDAEMSLEEYEDFVYGAGLLDDPDPVARWREVSARQQRLVEWLKGRKQVRIQGANADITLSIQGRAFDNADGRENFPDGEVYTSPIEDSVNGWVRFTYPAVFRGREIVGIELTFEAGKVVKASARKNEEALLALLNTDAGASYLGELGIGTNPGITRFTKHILFDEKIQGSFHLALGAGFPELGGQNQSAIHEDLVCDLHDGEIRVDDELFYQNGNFVVEVI